MSRSTSVRDLLRVEPGSRPELGSVDPSSTPGFKGGRSKARAALEEVAAPLAELQERLYAERTRSVVLLLQGMDASGKGGAIKQVAGALNPAWCQVTSFKKPTEEELAHHYLWRVERALPAPGLIGIFDRSHYEDVLVVRVHELVGADEIEGRYDEINAWEDKLTSAGTTFVKCMLHISRDEQRERMLARLDEPDKHWKFKESDLDERDRWADYESAYVDALQRCSTAAAPWYVVPADRKWYRSWAVSQLLLETLRELDPQFPRPDLDIARLRSRLATEG
jgi:PPK2 family polyphosphate:nucleotide phosphotransferase